MRPIRRGPSPQAIDFKPYGTAKPELVSRLGLYCSYCERPIKTNLAVEHLQPKKGAHGRPELEGTWENFLLACVNCNSAKGSKQVVLSELMLPDRDNSFVCFKYTQDGKVSVSSTLGLEALEKARDTLSLVGLDKAPGEIRDFNERLVALDRVEQRKQAWLFASMAKDDLANNPDNELLREYILRFALATGFFSVWLTVFSQDMDMCIRLITAFPGTAESGCFDLATAEPVSPAPNPDGLADGGKV